MLFMVVLNRKKLVKSKNNTPLEKIRLLPENHAF